MLDEVLQKNNIELIPKHLMHDSKLMADIIKENSNLFTIVDGYVLSYEVHMVKPYIGIYKELFKKYSLIPKKTLIIDDNASNIKTALSLKIKGVRVKPDNYDDLLNKLKSNKIKF